MRLATRLESARRPTRVRPSRTIAGSVMPAKAGIQPLANTPQDTKAALTRLVALAQDKGGQDPGALPAYIAQLTALASPHEQALVQQIAAIVADAGGYDDAINQLEQLAVATRPTALAETIALGLAAANLAGRGEV